MMSVLINTLAIAGVFGLVIFVHEFGHFIVAKKTGVKVERFSFGLGPEIFGFQWGETRYCLAWIPLGGEVRMSGEMEYEEGDETPRVKDPREFFALPWYRRIPIVVAGPIMNYVLAFFIFALVAFVWGEPQLSPDAVIGDVMQGLPAERAGLKSGDRILSIAGQPVMGWQDLAAKIHQFPEQNVALQYQRGTETQSVQITPRRDPSDEKRGLIGIAPSTIHKKVGFIDSLGRGGQQVVGWSVFTLKYLGEKIVRREKPELSGPIGIASVVAKATKSGIQDLLYLVALISVGIGLFNFFPIPLLDGGHLVFYLWEGITRKPVTRRVMSAANTVGLTLLLGILLFATYSDIQRIRPAKASSEAADIRP